MPTLYEKMNGAGWLGWPITTACHAGVNGETPVAALKTTRAYREFKEGRCPPKFEEKDAEKGTLIHDDAEHLPILINRRQGLIKNNRRDHGFGTVAYLEDVHPSRLAQANPFGQRP